MNFDQNDIYFEAVLRQAVIDRFDNELKEALASQTPQEDYPSSSSFDARMKKQLKKEQLSERRVKAVKWYSNVASVLLLVCVVLGLTIVSVPNLRNTLVNYLTSLSTEESLQTESAHINNIQPTRIPDGYSLAKTYDMNTWRTLLYQDKLGNEIVIDLYIPAAVSEKIFELESDIRGESETWTESGVLFRILEMDEDENKIIFQTEDYVGMVAAPLPVEILIDISTSIINSDS